MNRPYFYRNLTDKEAGFQRKLFRVSEMQKIGETTYY